MKTSQIIILLLLTIISIAHETYASLQQNDESLIETTCKNTPNYTLCAATLRASPNSATADVAGLALIMVDAVRAKAEQALTAVDSLLKSGGQPKLSEPLRRCADYYNAVLKGDVPMAVEALTKGDPKFGESGMADAAAEAELCEGGFESGVAPSPLSGVDKDVRDLAVVARAIIRSLL